MNEAELIRRAMSALGKRTSERKKISSRKNAKRPRKKKAGWVHIEPDKTEKFKTERKPETYNAAILYPDGSGDIYYDPTQFPKA